MPEYRHSAYRTPFARSSSLRAANYAVLAPPHSLTPFGLGMLSFSIIGLHNSKSLQGSTKTIALRVGLLYYSTMSQTAETPPSLIVLLVNTVFSISLFICLLSITVLIVLFLFSFINKSEKYQDFYRKNWRKFAFVGFVLPIVIIAIRLLIMMVLGSSE